MFSKLLVLNLIAAAAIVASAGVWATVFRRVKRGRDVVPLEPRRPATWTIVDLGLSLIAYLLFAMLVRVLLRDVWRIDLPADVRQLGAEHLASVQLASMAVTLATLIFTIALVRVRIGATAVDLGLSLRRWRYDVLLGALAFVALAPPVYAMQGILVHFFPTQHPLIDILDEQPDAWTIAVVAVSVAVVAPFGEEFFLRMFVQGWLESIIAQTAPSAFATDPGSNNDSPSDQSLPPTAHNPSGDSPAANASRQSAQNDENLDVHALRAIPIVISALVFALLHVGHGPAPIPLFFLALGLGYLYQRTHRLWPSVVVHALLNASSLAMLGLQE